MGSHAAPPDWDESETEDDETTARLGELLSGRLSDIEIDSVAAVREHRERT